MLTILLPAYNEEADLPPLLEKLRETMEANDYAYRVLVVNDGSRDTTLEVACRYATEMPLEVLDHPINRGLWETVRDGFEWAAANSERCDIIIRMDADNTHEPKYIPSMVKKIEEGYDVVIASRFLPGGGAEGLNTYRTFISRCANLVMKSFFPIRGLKEYSCGYRAYRASVVQDAIRIFGNDFIDLRGVGFTCTLEKLIKFRMMKARFGEVPFVLRYDQKQGSSKMLSSITTLGYLILILKYIYPWGPVAKRWVREIRELEWGRAAPTEAGESPVLERVG
jgi:dolichol-phosphate mannosyltransferase